MDLTHFINAYRGPLIGLLASWGAPWPDAIEIAQDCFAEAWMRRESCRGNWDDPEVFGRWLRGVALNQYRNWARSRRRRRTRIVTLEPAHLETIVAPPHPVVSDLLDSLRRAITRLPAGQRQVVLMHYLEETSVNQVAALLSITPKAVEARLYQARRSLRRLISDSLPASTIGRLLLCLCL
jgi:RNA polymerase sigma factor (sigma-70 family)